MENKREIYLDVLRILAFIGVVILHVCAENFMKLSGRSIEWHILNVYEVIGRYCVPSFVMISGALFLGRDISIAKLYKKYISRLAAAYVFWSVSYTIAYAFLKPGFGRSFKGLAAHMLTGEFHMWFILMLIGLYLCIPIFRQIVKNKQVMLYFLWLSLIFAFLLPQIFFMLRDFFGTAPEFWLKRFERIYDMMNVKVVMGLSFYFVLGHYLNITELNLKQRTIVYVLGGIGFFATIGMNGYLAYKSGDPFLRYYDKNMINIMLETIAVFVFLQYSSYNAILTAWAPRLSKLVFGAYWVHVFFRDMLMLKGINNLTFNPLFAVPVLVLVISFVSLACSVMLNKIPYANKWLV